MIFNRYKSLITNNIYNTSNKISQDYSSPNKYKSIVSSKNYEIKKCLLCMSTSPNKCQFNQNYMLS